MDDLEDRYPDIQVIRYDIADRTHHDRLRELASIHGAEQYLGVVPLTFVGDDFFVGFDSDEGIGLAIEESLIESLSVDQISKEGIETEAESTSGSLLWLAITLGFLDGFNVCSLGALVLILGLVLTLRSRRAIITCGGVFILTTAIVYGLLIFFWHQLFTYIAPYFLFFQILIASIGLLGGIYFLKEFHRFSKYGTTCSSSQSTLVSRLTTRVQNIFEEGGNFLSILGAIILFAGVITIIEFPCSAAVPVMFAGVLAEAGLSSVEYFSLIALFVLFYMLDEILVFGVAAAKMKVWLMSPTFTKWSALVEGLFLLAFGFYYIFSIFGVF